MKFFKLYCNTVAVGKWHIETLNDKKKHIEQYECVHQKKKTKKKEHAKMHNNKE